MVWFRIRGQTGLGRALAGCRRAAGLTQAELAERIGVERTTMIRMERVANPALARLVSAFAACGFDLVAVPRDAAVVVTPAEPDDRS